MCSDGRIHFGLAEKRGCVTFGFSHLTPRFCDGVIGNGASIDHDCAAVFCIPRILRNHIGLISIQPTAERDDFRSLIVGRVKSCGHEVLRH